MATGVMNSGYYLGVFIAAGLNDVIGAQYGWRVMFALGLLPALFIAYVRAYVQEPERWRARMAETGGWRARDSFLALFSPEYRRRTLLNSVLRADLDDRPLGRNRVCANRGHPGGVARGLQRRRRRADRLARDHVAGNWHDHRCLVMPALTHQFGRRGALACFFSVMPPR
jgi:hypothetical protein